MRCRARTRADLPREQGRSPPPSTRMCFVRNDEVVECGGLRALKIYLPLVGTISDQEGDRLHFSVVVQDPRDPDLGHGKNDRRRRWLWGSPYRDNSPICVTFADVRQETRPTVPGSMGAASVSTTPSGTTSP